MRASLSALHAEIGALIWKMENMKNLIEFHVTFATDYSQLVKMVLDPEKLSAFETYLEDIHILKERFSYLEISRTQNTRTDSLVRIAMNQSSYIVYMDTRLPIWFAKCLIDDTKKEYKNLLNMS